MCSLLLQVLFIVIVIVIVIIIVIDIVIVIVIGSGHVLSSTSGLSGLSEVHHGDFTDR